MAPVGAGLQIFSCPVVELLLFLVSALDICTVCKNRIQSAINMTGLSAQPAARINNPSRFSTRLTTHSHTHMHTNTHALLLNVLRRDSCWEGDADLDNAETQRRTSCLELSGKQMDWFFVSLFVTLFRFVLLLFAKPLSALRLASASSNSFQEKLVTSAKHKWMWIFEKLF